MFTVVRVAWIGVLSVSLAAFMPLPTAAAEKLSEDQKIEKLIVVVEKLKDATFVRNGTEHSAKEAADHMRRKWKTNQGEIKSVRDFIRVAASKSGISGKAYLIRFKDKREVTSAEFLTKELERIEKEG